MTPENTFIGSVHDHLPSITKLYRMKNHNMYNGGIADCWYSAGTDLWIEYKFLKVPTRGATVMDFMSGGKRAIISPLQQEWLKDRHEEGRNVWVVIGSEKGGVVFQKRLWEHTLTADTFRQNLLNRKEIAQQIQEFVT